MFGYDIFNTTFLVVAIFLIITLIIGLISGRNINTFEDYVLGGKRFNTFTLTLTLLATYIGGGATINSIKEIHNFGIIVFLSYLGLTLQFLFFAFFIANKYSNFKDCITIGDLMKKFYNRNIGILSGFITMLFALLIAAKQIVLLGKIFNIFLNFDTRIGILIIGIILSIYTSFGGIKSVTITDVIHFLILIIIFPIIATFALKKVGGYKNLFTNLPNYSLDIFSNSKFLYYLIIFCSHAFLLQCLLAPGFMQRIFMASSQKQVRNKFLFVSVFDPIFRLMILLIGLCTIILYPKLKSYNIVSFMIGDLFKSKIMQGLSISAIIAVVMTTADSYIHSVGLVLSHDILKPIFKFKNELITTKKVSFLVSILIILMAYLINLGVNIRDLTIWTSKLTAPILLFPILFGIFDLKTSSKQFWYSAVISVITLFASDFLLQNFKMLSMFIATIISGISFIIVHLFENKGILLLKNEQNESKEEPWIPNFSVFLDKIFNAIPTPKKILQYSRKQVIKNGSNNILFGIYICINFIFPYIIWDHKNEQTFNMITYLRLIGAIMAGLLIVKDQWKEFLKPYFSIFWHFTLTYCLPFITTIMFFISEGSLPWLMNIGVSIFFLIILVSGEMFLILAPIGIGLGITFYKLFFGNINISSFGFDKNYLLIYQLIFPTLIGILFAYRKRIFNIIKGNIGLNLGFAFSHEIKNTLYSLTCNQFNKARIDKIIASGTQSVAGEESYIISKKILESISDQTEQAINFDEDTLKVVKTFEKIFKDYKYSINNPKVYSMKSIVQYTLRELHFLPGQKEKINVNLTDDFYVKVPKDAFAFVISNIIRNAFKHGKATKVEIILNNNNQLHIKDNGRGVPSSDLEKIFKMHYTTGLQDSSGIGLGFAKLIVESCFGKIWCESKQGENSYTEFIIQFPQTTPDEISMESILDAKLEASYIEKEKIARKMFAEGENLEKIKIYTGLTNSNLKNIEKSMKE